ncbi:MAG TPA: hypothetical protein VK425_09630 [Acidimicrobiales bacterium]|nr:hypothetical protein [Acidimicrobiales bacterium]
MATSVQTSDGTWATVPMGRLDEPLNTFWQLFYRPAGSASWSDQVEATATATNGGLVLAATGTSLLVGVRPSVNLTFTPMISTSNGGRSWSDGLVTATLAARPDALAIAGTEALALVGSRTGPRVLAASRGISTWRSLVTRGALAGGAGGKACGLGAITAVGYLGARPLLGGSCANSGIVGLFAQAVGGWRLVGPVLPRPLDRGQAEVLALQTFGARALALIAVVTGRSTNLAVARSSASGWSASPPLAVADNEQVASFGPAGPGGFFALLQEPSGADRLAVSGRRGGPWQQLPAPPPGAATVAFNADGPTNALVAQGTRFSVWSLRPGSQIWAKAQVTDVPVQYGSSS